jgi:hypothetical protein
VVDRLITAHRHGSAGRARCVGAMAELARSNPMRPG